MLGHTEASRTTSAVSQEARTGRGLDRPATKKLESATWPRRDKRATLGARGLSPKWEGTGCSLREKKAPLSAAPGLHTLPDI